jgi:signal transduction histidine kinase
MLPVGVWVTDRRGRIVEGNPAGKQIWAGARYVGIEQYGEYRGWSVSTGKRIEPDEWAAARAITRGETSLAEEIEIECFDGTHKFILNSAIPLRDPDGRITGAIIVNQDITERKRAEEQLRALAGHVEFIREEERTTIAREIHDELGQMLTGLKLDLSWLSGRVAAHDKMSQEKTRGMLSLIDETIRSVRRIATSLRPGILDDLGLEPAIEWQVQDFAARTGIRCDFTTGLRCPLQDTRQSTALFRILQEALTNVARHAHATLVTIFLKGDTDWVDLCVEDNGRGITHDEVAKRTSLGLLGMRERVRLLGGEFNIAGQVGEGTTIAVRIPFTHPASSSKDAPGATVQAGNGATP